MPMEKTFNATEAEDRLYKAWEDAGAFRAGANAKPGAAPFSIMIPPPNVTGSLHMGHAFNNTLQDVLVRWHRMRGFDTLWQPGTDHAGIATQMVTEREMAANGEGTRREMGREKFVERVWQQKVKSRGTIIGQLKRLGASCDWSREAFTMGGAPGDPDRDSGAPNFHDAVMKVFVRMYEDGLIYRGKRLVNWDPHFETAISDLEVENIETPGHMWHFKYPLAGGETYEYVEKDEDGTVTLRETRDYISIATTRPETMLGDGAVAVHPSDERYAPIIGKLCEIPVGPKEHRRLIPIITDEYPDKNFGSGAVKITGAHDFNDYQVAKRGGIPMYALMDTKGAMRRDGRPYAEEAEIAGRIARGEEEFDEAKIAAMNLVPEAYRGLDRIRARERVVADITAEGLAVMVPESDPRLGRASAASKPPKGGAQQGAPTDSFEEGATPPELALVPLVESKPIMQPFGDRSKVVIEPMLTDQWFVDTDKIVGPALDAVRKGQDRPEGSTDGTKILPERDAKVYFHWLENIEPWCISRQLWWGHRIPVWYGPELASDGSLHDNKSVEFCASSFEEVQDSVIKHYRRVFPGREICVQEHERDDFDAHLASQEAHAVFSEDARAIGTAFPPYNAENSRKSIPYWHSITSTRVEIGIGRDPDVLDTWFSSGLWPIGTLGWPEDTEAYAKYFPTSVLVTGFDIIFFWVARMMMMQYAVVGEKPFHTVYVHALVRDEKGKKMSKSLGNVLDPLELIDEYGADAVRFTLAAMAAMGRDLKLSTARIAGYRNFGTKLWNAARFAEMNGVFELPPVAAAPRPALTVNAWIVGETARARADVDAALAAYRFNDAASVLYSFVWGRVCDWYVEFAKPLLFSDDPEVLSETRTTMRWVLDQCMILLHPMMPFLTEELWATTGPRDGMLALADWPTDRAADLANPEADREMGWVISLIDAVRSLRGEMHVPAGAKIPMLQLDLDAAGQSAWTRNEALIMRLARIDSLTRAEHAPKGSATIAVEGGTFCLPLAEIIDVAEEKERLEKTLAKLEKEMGGMRARVNNPKFVASAPEDVVQDTRDQLALKEEEAEKMRAAHARLAELD